MSEKTLFVVGAGASDEAGMPFGDRFKEAIANAVYLRNEGDSVVGDSTLAEALRDFAWGKLSGFYDPTPYFNAGWRIREALPQAISIDHYLDAHRGDKHVELCGKLGIVATILAGERKSSLFVSRDRRIDYKSISKTWYGAFFRLITENCRPADLQKRLGSVAFVVFNYDRCVEHYLYVALQNYYSISSDAAASLLKHLEVYHPYGTVGSLPWQNGPNPIEFGGQAHPKQLLALAGEIKTFAEETESASHQLNGIQDCVKFSRLIVFLGFAFHRMNMDLLMPHVISADGVGGKTMYGTAFQISRSNVEDIKGHLAERARTHSPAVHLERDLQCKGLIDEYWRALSLVR